MDVNDREGITLRRRLALFLICLLITVTVPVQAAEPPRIVLNGVELALPSDQKPIIVQDRTMVPMRAIFQALGARLIWEEDLRRVTARRGDLVVTLQIGLPTATVGGREVQLDLPPQIVGGRTYVPLRFVTSALDGQIDWVAATRTVVINTPASSTPSGLVRDPGAFEVSRFSGGSRIAPRSEGIYFLRDDTGKVEGWTLADAEEGPVVYSASADHRFVIARSAASGFLADRTTGNTYYWSRGQIDLVTAGGGQLLFEETSGHLEGTGRYRILTYDLLPVSTFTQTDGSHTPAQPDTALFAPDGKSLALSTNGNTYLVTVATGSMRLLEAIGGRLLPLPAQRAKPAFAMVAEGDTRSIVRTYGWDGLAIHTATVPAGRVYLSPDGLQVAYELTVADFAPAVYVTDLFTGTTLFRAVGATVCSNWSLTSGPRWLADGSGLVVSTKAGRKLLSKAGEVRDLPILQKAGLDLPLPSSANTGRFGWQNPNDEGTWTMAIMDTAGTVRQGVTLTGENQLLPVTGSTLWGETADELRFSVRSHPPTGAPCGDYAMPLPVMVQRSPLPGTDLQLTVTGTGDCLNLREQPTLTGKVLACLPDGTRLSLGTAVKFRAVPGAVKWIDGATWLQVRTTTGTAGWVMLSAGYLDWAK